MFLHSIEEIRTFHTKGFKSYLKRGIDQKIRQKIAQACIDKLCKAIDPSADLDFDYLGIQTLYDRYLVVDKTGEVARRLETPQFFGCVLVMGVFAHEENRRANHFFVQLI